MATVISVPLYDGVLEVETNDRAVSGRAARGAGILPAAATSLEDALTHVRPLARAILDSVRGIDVTPDEVEVKFGLKLTAEANIILSATSAEANIEFTLKWKNNSSASVGQPPPNG